MAIIKSFASYQNLSNFGTFINDQLRTSEYFRITEFKDTFTGGKNGFLIEGSEHLKETTEIKIEILDVTGIPIYYEPGNGIPEYYEGISKIVSVHVYEDTPIGLGKITVLGELKTYIDDNGVVRDVPAEWRGIYNIKWERTFNVNKNLANETIVRFYQRPKITIDEINKPIFNITTPSVTQTGLVEGIPQQPVYGTDIRNWTAGTLYKLKITDGSNWTSSVDENLIEIPSLGYSATVREVLNNKEVFVDVPHTSSYLVSNFPATAYTTTFDHIEGQTLINSALTGSFAKIQLSDLKTFVGDVARVKVYRKSRNEVGDYQFIQDTKLESSEILKDITTTTTTELSYGQFTQTNIKNYWISGSTAHPITINVDKLNASVKVDYSGSNYDNPALFITSQSLSLTEGVEYTLSFKTLLSGSNDSTKTLKAYFSGSAYPQQTIVNVTNSAIYTTKQNVTQNVKATKTGDAKLVFEFAGDDWYLANVSLQNAQETSFSPDEFTLIQDIPRKLASETYDFKFEFYDINNNYIPVDVKTSKTFNGGNSFTTTSKILTFESDRTAFRFSSGSFGNPAFQQVGFSIGRTNLTGSVTYASAAFDSNGNYIVPASYGGIYPGGLTNAGDGGASLTIANFSGSVTSVLVGSITYTASCDGLNEFETIYRFEDGDNAPGLFTTSNANQFIYKATDLSLNPSGQVITIEAKRKNLASTSGSLEVNSGSLKPPLTVGATDASSGVTLYTLAGSAYPFLSGSTTYSFTGSDQFGNKFSDAITITPVKILDGLSVSLTNENASLPALSTGFVASGSFVLTSGSVSVKVGNETITHSDGLVISNSFDVVSAVGTGVTTGSLTYSTSDYFITRLDADSGSLELRVRYKDGAGDTTDVTKVATYTKNKKAAPVLSFVIGNNNQTTTAKSTGAQIDAFVTASFVVNETYNGVTTSKIFTTSSVSATNSYQIGTATNTTLALPTMSLLVDSVDISITGSVIDSENTTRNVFGNISLAKAKKAVPNVIITATPLTQTISATSQSIQVGTLLPVTLDALEGATSVFNSASIVSSNFTSPSISTNTLTLGSIGNSISAASASISVNFTNSEGTSNNSTILVSATKVNAGNTGVTGSNGAVGGDGPGVVFRGPWSAVTTYNSISQDPTRKDVVLYSGTYYATKTNAAANLNKQPDTQTTFWESLGTDSFFVAAEMFISKESYVQNTINVGTNASGNANIAIAGGSTSPYISIGQATKGYNNVGAFLGSDGTNGKLSLKSSTNSLTWDGATLSIVGNINVGSAVPNSVVTGLKALALKDTVSSTEIDAGAVTEGKIGADAVTEGKLAANAVTEGKLAANAVTEGKISANAVVAGKIAADAVTADKIAAGSITVGKISAGAITADKISADAVTADKIAAGSITAVKIDAGAITTDKLAAGAITAGKIDAGAITTDKLAAGAVTAAKVDVAGVITAGSIVVAGNNISTLNNNSGYQANGDAKTGGSVGGWSITSTEIQGGAPASGGDGSYTSQGIRLGAGGYISAKNFYISSTGDASFKGNITATGGSFTGDVSAGTVTIGTGGITFGNVTISGGGISMSGGSNLAIDGTLNMSSTYGYITSLQQYSAFTTRLRLYENYGEGGHYHSLTFDKMQTGTGTTMVLTSGGYVVKNSSSRRYKKNIKSLSLNSAKRILNLNVATFKDANEADSNEHEDNRHTGLIAEEVNDLNYTDWVIRDKGGVVDGLYYQSIFSSMIKVVQDLNNRIEVLEARLSGSV